MSDVAPKNGEYLNGKLWFVRKGSTVTVGLTNSAIEELGEIEGIDLPVEGDDFTRGDVVVTVEGTHGSLEVLCPATGVIDDINGAAKDEPEVVAEDPLEEGWLIKIEIEDPTELRDPPGST